MLDVDSTRIYGGVLLNLNRYIRWLVPVGDLGKAYGALARRYAFCCLAAGIRSLAIKAPSGTFRADDRHHDRASLPLVDARQGKRRFGWDSDGLRLGRIPSRDLREGHCALSSNIADCLVALEPVLAVQRPASLLRPLDDDPERGVLLAVLAAHLRLRIGCYGDKGVGGGSPQVDFMIGDRVLSDRHSGKSVAALVAPLAVEAPARGARPLYRDGDRSPLVLNRSTDVQMPGGGLSGQSLVPAGKLEYSLLDLGGRKLRVRSGDQGGRARSEAGGRGCAVHHLVSAVHGCAQYLVAGGSYVHSEPVVCRLHRCAALHHGRDCEYPFG